MPRLSELRIDISSVGYKDRGDARVIALCGHVERRLPVGPMRARKSGSAGQELADSLHLARANRREESFQIGIVRRDALGRGSAAYVRRHQRIELLADLLDVGLELSPARKAELPGNGELCFAENCVGVSGAEYIEALLAEFLEPLEISAERERSGHEDTFFQGARRPRLTGRKKVVGIVGLTSGFNPARGLWAARHGLRSLYATGANPARLPANRLT
jgi:hypothetical protein